MNQRLNCCICSQIAGKRENDLISQLLGEDSYVRRVILESENFAVVPSLGPVVPGHVLLCPRRHYKSFASISNSYVEEFESIKSKMKGILRSVYNKAVHCFEHGMATHGDRTACTVEHAHLHLIPIDADVWQTLSTDFRWQHFVSEIVNAESLTDGSEYLYYESPQGVNVVTRATPDVFQSQYLRKVFIQALGKSNSWNWRKEPAPQKAHYTYLTLTQRLEFDDEVYR